MEDRRKSVLFSVILLACFNCSYGCSVQGTIGGTIFISPNPFRDVDRGTIIDTGTTNILDIQSISYGGDLNGGPYVDISFVNNRVLFVTNNNYENYEEVETTSTISADVTFICSPGSPQSTLTVTFRIDVQDTNNNAPQFIPSSIGFNISTPVPPNFDVTGCGNEIVVRDIDLTTRAVHFTVDNPDFEIESVIPLRPKEFKAVLRTTTLIRSISEPIVLTITATDEDNTGDPPLTTEARVIITDNTDFTMPDELVFSRTFYHHNYDTTNNDIVPTHPIHLRSGFDDEVRFYLYGELSDYFKLDTQGETATIMLDTVLPDDVLSKKYIFFEVRAEREDTAGAASTVIIQLPEARELRFEESSYRGSIQNNDITLRDIQLAVGYDENIEFDLSGEFSNYFILTDEKNSKLTLHVKPTIPENVILDNNLIYLTVTASGPNAITTTTSILLDIIKDDLSTPVFSRNIYYGTYLGDSIDIQNINLIQGFDKNLVSFKLDGEHSEYFEILGEDNNLELSLRSQNIPEDVIFNKKVLVFNILAEKALTVGAHAAIVIRFSSDLTDTAVMRFSQNTYIGKYESNELKLDNVILSSGYAPTTEFILTGEYETYFKKLETENTVSLSLDKDLPTDTIEDSFIVLEIEARRERAASVWTSVVIDIVKHEIVPPVFTKTYYTGVYNANMGLRFDEVISLLSGFDETVTFDLEGELSNLFELVPSSSTNSFTIDTKETLSAEILTEHSNLLFTVLAKKPGVTDAHSVIVIDIEKYNPEASTIGFERVSYVGSLQNNAVDLIPITLIEGYTDDAVFALYGELAEYFRVPNEGPEVILQLPSPIPAHLIPESGIIVLDIRASVPETGTAYATIVLEVVTEDDGNSVVQLQFDATFYTGSYGASGLSVRTPIVLSKGFEDGVQFNLEGDDSQWFNVVPDQNKATLIVGNGIPEAVLLSKQQLVFAITAQKPGSITARATIVISLTDEYPPTSTIGFERVSYVGSLQNNAVDLIPITLIEGYTDDAVFALYGELAEYFRVPNEGPEVILQLPSPIPAHLIPGSGIIVLDIRASVPETGTAYATIVLEVVTEDDGNSVVQLQFDATFYTGSYGASGLSVRTPIVLSEGFEDGVQFNLEGDDSQWFNVVPDQNKATLIVGNGIPEAVLLSKQQLVFAITAQKPGSITARATIVISLTDEYPPTSTIGFERVSYVGSLQNNAVDLIPITLIEGYTDDAVFALYGELAEYFRVPNEGPEVNLQLPSPIPAHLIPESGIIVLDIRASVPETGTAYATIVLEVVTEDDGNSVVQLKFDATFYTGSYGASGLSVRTPIVLSEGFEDGVQFNLEGDDSQWFNVVPDQNKATLIVGNGIPEAVLLSKQQLVFAITAQKPGSITARATIVISLTDEYPPTSTIGFERVSYVGSLQNNAVDLIPITLIEGYTDDAVFALYGELAEYFRVPNEGPEVILQLPSPIPAHLIPESGIIVLDIRASVPETGTAYATIVLEVVTEDDGNSVVQLQFDATFYTGSYGASGLSVRTPIVLSEGFEDGVQFNLEGDDSQWFNVVPDQNKATLIVGNGIPEAVLLSKQQLVFAITAQKPGSITARATIVISLTDEYPPTSTIGFERVSYVGSLQNNAVDLIPITLIEGYTDDAVFALYGELAEYFRVPNEGPEVNLQLPSPIPAHLIPESGIIVLDIRASVPETGTAYATIVLEVVTEDDGNSVVQLQFDATFYTGSYGASGLSVRTPIVLSEGFEDGVQFNLEGDDSQWFNVVPDQNKATLIVGNGIPEAVLLSKQQLVFAITAQKPGSITARATIVISLTDEYPPTSTIGFERVSYVGSLQNNAVDLIPITLIEGYTDDAVFALYGELAEYFRVPNEGPEVILQLPSPIPAHLIPESGIIVLDIRASVPETGTAYATIVLEVVTEDDGNSVVQLQFDATFYTGSYGASGLSVRTPIVLSEGFEDGVQFNLEGDDSQWFNVVPDQNKATLIVGNGIPEAVLLNKQQLVFAITAQKPGSITARATIVISLTDEYPPTSTIGFERVSYVGSLQNNAVDLIPITLIEGYTDDAVFALYGELAEYFRVPNEGPEVNLQLPSPIPAHLIPESGIIVLDIRASVPETGTAYATIVLEVVTEDDGNSVVQLQFDATFYTGSYGASGLSVRTPIILSEGFEDGVQFNLEGDDSQWFNVVPDQNKATLIVGNGIPEAVLLSNQPLVFAITAQRPGSITARATIVISVTDDLPIGEHLSFEKVLYRGSIELGEVKHEDIIIPGFDGTTVLIIGEYSDLLMATALDGVVTVTPRGSLNLPAYVTRLDLELRAATARAVLILNIKGTDPEVPGPPPTVTFTSESYAVTVEIVQTGIVGRVVATSDNKEALTYSLANVNLHLQSRLSINNEGELFLSAPANSGVYTFQVIATTVITEATGTATVHLTVHAAMVCGGDIVVPPLITLDRDEEEPHNDLVVHEPNHVGCHYVLTNQFPADQDWLYVDENGLHARRIDREHTSIAFMALSQVQVELILHCESDNNVRTKRSQRTDWLGPYDYGTKNWILTDSIRYNSRRSLVNLIVNDINDNDPIFVGKEHEPIAVGFPIDELKERILPRSLVELKATDADIGLNAELRYWSSESALAVAPTTGFVHVQSSVQLENNQILTVHATDRKGEGNTGSIQLVVKRLTANNIAVVTVRNAFLDDEANILEQLSEAVGYDVKALRSVVISEDTEPSRQSQGTGVSLQLYVYGVINREPVAVDRLTENINNNSEIVNVISSVPLEDHLEDSEIQHYIGLLAATIVLSILLFILILLIAIWYFLRWRKNRNYDQFSDNKSIVSSNESLGDLSKPAENEPVNLQPRLNIDDLKRSERRLQEMLDAPIEEVSVEPVPSTAEPVPFEAILDISMPEINVPIVIQSIDKLKDAEDSGDEFGEINKTPRKSVVTFNENVEKIIHVEDDTDNSSQSGYEIYKF